MAHEIDDITAGNEVSNIKVSQSQYQIKYVFITTSPAMEIKRTHFALILANSYSNRIPYRMLNNSIINIHIE